LRLHIGLENADDLKAGLDRSFAALKAAGQAAISPKLSASHLRLHSSG
jgi:hypothetical protein